MIKKHSLIFGNLKKSFPCVKFCNYYRMKYKSQENGYTQNNKLFGCHFIILFSFRIIKVEQPVARLPPHRSLRAVFSHRALQDRSLSHSRYSPYIPSLSSGSRYSDLGCRNLKISHEVSKSSPIIGLALTPSIQPLHQDFLCSIIEYAESLTIP